jgi:hypothetical protein
MNCRLMLLTLSFALFAGASAAAQMTNDSTSPAAVTGTQTWQAGWDNFGEPIKLTSSNIIWSLAPTRKLTVAFTLVGATPNKLYQVGIHLFCDTAPVTFGQFPVTSSGGSCFPITRQGVTKKVAAVEFGVVMTDIHGKGSFKVVVGPIASGTYNFEFTARDGAGCNLIGGAGNGTDCYADFQSPGPFGTATTITVP